MNLIIFVSVAVPDNIVIKGVKFLMGDFKRWFLGYESCGLFVGLYMIHIYMFTVNEKWAGISGDVTDDW